MLTGALDLARQSTMELAENENRDHTATTIDSATKPKLTVRQYFISQSMKYRIRETFPAFTLLLTFQGSDFITLKRIKVTENKLILLACVFAILYAFYICG